MDSDAALARQLQADDPQLQARALELMPLAGMRADAQQTFNLNSEGTNLPGPLGLGVDDFLAKELLAWFKTSFFSWVDVAACQACGNTSTQSSGPAPPNPDEMAHRASRTELYTCPQ
ncbi:TGc domain-containing protein, partial [Haematococcus lacustris]